MFTAVLTSLSSFCSGLLGGFGLNSAATALSVGAGAFVLSKFIGKFVSRVIQFFIIFVIGMMIYRHMPAFKDMIDNICSYIDTYLPSLISNVKTAVNQ